MKTKLPEPDQPDRERSLKLERQICREIEANCGTLGFDRYMEMCLYTEQIGYYTSDHAIFGEQGDFVTSSEKSVLFARAIAAHLLNLPSEFRQFNIIEIGAGSGRFAAQLLAGLAETDLSIQQYSIIEKSSTLRARQQHYLQTAVPELYTKLDWQDTAAAPVANAVIIANEVIDALPVRLLTVQNQQVFERCVQRNANHKFEFVDVPADKSFTTIVQETLEGTMVLKSKRPYHTEICLQLTDFVQQIASLVHRGIFFFIDYGYPRAEYYLEQRAMGTLLCHYKNVAHENPLIWPGLQDISSNVEFTALANAGIQAGLQLNSYSTQAHFLLASNILANLEQAMSNQEFLRCSQQLKHLILPNEMGERFQVMTFTKSLGLDCDQFTIRDLSHRL